MAIILHLEDDGPLRDILQIAITAAEPSAVFKAFIGSDDAVDYIRANVNDIDLYVLDIRVPGSMNGLGVAQKIRELGSKKPIILTSAYRKPDQEVLKDLECRWMAKPMHILDAHKIILPLIQDKRKASQYNALSLLDKSATEENGYSNGSAKTKDGDADK